MKNSIIELKSIRKSYGIIQIGSKIYETTFIRKQTSHGMFKAQFIIPPQSTSEFFAGPKGNHQISVMFFKLTFNFNLGGIIFKITITET